RAPERGQRTCGALRPHATPARAVPSLLVRLSATPAGRAAAWAFLRRRWTALRKRIPPLMLARLVDATPALRTQRHAREVRAFFRAHPLPEASRAVRQALERFRLNAELRRRTAPRVKRWLARSAS